jgi:hypothetical protein
MAARLTRACSRRGPPRRGIASALVFVSRATRLKRRSVSRSAMNLLELRPAVEESRNVLSIVIDGRTLREYFAGRLGGLPPSISPIGWRESPPDHRALTIRGFLLEAPSPLEGERHPVLVCGKCGDVGCGAYTALVERHDETVRWSDFRFESANGEKTKNYDSVGPFTFAWPAYAEEFRSALKRG